jgi:hypothetical protein
LHIDKRQDRSRINKKVIIGTVIGLLIGLALGVFVSVLFNLPSSFHTGVGVNNQVQVSGTVQAGVISGSTLYFQNINRTILTSASIINGQYSVLLVGGQSYNIYGYNPTVFEGEKGYSPHSNFNPFYLPVGVTAFTENLVSS